MAENSAGLMIATAFKDYREKLIGDDADDDFISGHMTTFFAGAWVVHAAMIAAFYNNNCPGFLAIMEQLRDEFIQQNKDMAEAVGIKSN